MQPIEWIQIASTCGAVVVTFLFLKQQRLQDADRKEERIARIKRDTDEREATRVELQSNRQFFEALTEQFMLTADEGHKVAATLAEEINTLNQTLSRK